MPAPRNRRHIIVPGEPAVEPYTPHVPFIPRTPIPAPRGGRRAHGKRLEKGLRDAHRAVVERRKAVGFEVHGAQPGLYVQFESVPGVPLNIASLEDQHKGIEVVAVTTVPVLDDRPGRQDRPKVVERATVFVPDGKVKHFVTRFEKYASEAPKRKGERRHEDMLDRVAALRTATLRALWTDEPAAYPGEVAAIWWEIWLRRTDGKELERFLEFTQRVELQVHKRRLEFDDRVVVLAFGTAGQLASSLDVLEDIAEVRGAKELAGFFADERPDAQAAWGEDLEGRIDVADGDRPAVCLLDTGVTLAHPLLRPVLDRDDRYSADPAWGLEDDGGHGTEMAGIASYGPELATTLASGLRVPVTHRLESVKILPAPGFPDNDPDLYGAVTATAVSYPESRVPERRRVFSMAVTSRDERDRGQPTSWSAAVDALAAGRSFDPTRQGLVYLDDDRVPRLFVVAAGNVTALDQDHLARSDFEPVHDPAQAWNALTVGAYTDKSQHNDPAFASWKPLAGHGDLSPWSTTSVGFAPPWPIKPDVVAEGGNVVVDGAGTLDFPVADLCLLTTFHKPNEKQFVPTWATSPASAAVARICAMVMAEYPDLWPETTRALVAHSAEWTPAMRAHLGGAGASKTKRAKLVRRYGFGVPSAARALRSADDALTLVAQGTIRPFSDGRMREMNVHKLPWPKEELEALADAPVRLRVTLSYFVEPNPARRGWQKRHRYQSHGLRFDVKGTLESPEEFRKRLNQRALEEEEERPAGAADHAWYLGERARNTGSLHSDTWSGTAADLAERGIVAVYPVTGWWKEQKKRDRSDLGVRYALVVSIETPLTETDIWTPVAQEVGIDVETAVEIG